FVVMKLFVGSEFVVMKLFVGSEFVVMKLFVGSEFVVMELFVGSEFVVMKLFVRSEFVLMKLFLPLSVLNCPSSVSKVFSAYIKEIEQKPQPTPWGNKMPFGNIMAEVSNAGGGWIHCVSFSTDGNKLAWVSHNSTISVVDAEADMKLVTLRTQYLPFITCLWSSVDTIVAAGYDCSPMVFQYNKQGQLSFVDKLGKSQKKETDGFRFTSPS
ncbi:actin-related protein 2/3 complex subunit 1A-like, partial [Limulus polyphemus]|uniref:Actin-related protein 2/3 complex subunit 1A-like n=1 Tax=Limulus polyphemus TaxID=6850 RepID=A0ABM1RWM2_LIMPO